MLPTKLTIRQPFKHRHHQRASRKIRSITVIHAKIRSSTDTKLNNHSIIQNRHVRSKQIVNDVNTQEDLSKKSLDNHQHYPLFSQSTSNASKSDNWNRHVQTKSDLSTPHRILSKSKVFDQQDMATNRCHSTEAVTNKWSNPSDVTNDHHRISKKKKKKRKCTRRTLFICLFCVVLIIAILTAVLLVLFLKPKQIINSTEAFLRWNSSGITIAGTGILGNASNQLNYPWNIVVDWSYAFYVTDRNNNRIQKFLMNSNSATTVAGQNLTLLNQPTGIYLDDQNNMYISDMGNQRALFWPKGALSGSILTGQTGVAGSALNQFNLPHSIQLDTNSETIFIADYNNNRIISYFVNNSSNTIAAGGNGSGTANTQVWNPHAAYYESLSNSLIIANYGSNNIVRWVLGATNWTLIIGSNNGTAGTTSALLNGPTDVVLDPMGNIYVVDRTNQRIQFFLNGQSNGTTIAGIIGQIGSNSTMLNYPSTLTLDNQLNLYVVDRFNHRVQKFLRY